MINLLPSEKRDNIMYARRNTKLLHLMFGIIVTIVVMAGAWGTGYMYIANSINSYNKEIDEKRASLKTQKLEETEARITGLSNNLKLILQVLGKEVLFSEIFKQIGAVMPDGTVLSSIEIAEVEGGMDLVAYARNHESATQVQVNLEDQRNKLFEKVDLVSVDCNDSSDTSYDCTVSLRALFAEDNPFLFINQNDKGSTP